MGEHFAWGLIGPGGIAQRFADAVQRLPDSRLAMVQGRDAARAAAFAAQWVREDKPSVRSTDSIAALLAEPGLDAVYIATPHAFHAAAIEQCLAAGKPVLCEKPLVTDAATAARLAALARERGVFLMEALWSRFLPAYQTVGQWLREQAIGPLRAIQSSFCFHTPFDATSRAHDPAQAGGALLDIGVYNLSLTRWALQQAGIDVDEAPTLHARALKGPTGVDQRLAVMLGFADGIAAQFVCGFDGSADNGMRIFGRDGVITLPEHFWEARRALLQRSGESPTVIDAPFGINGFEYEVIEAMRCIRAGAIESPLMPLDETIATLRWMDALRAQIGVRYPFE
ncbi:Gfo/Idh/MocA family oxidoreductase [Aquincola sp. S2]|uniref:Gfo/Idh/MocA family oxidoreductase n=1 Tax=Pseudaquabacterium terrae TaxID=2732868 RepID=A0ABX2EAC8_9BURK|nr:Gfo/Idh/MocA family oxidoreductase [Aquabacterium terrae]NRF66036.1 Gfo/Idh/MocA family oxidoreductase [Aquabacterium terrae]